MEAIELVRFKRIDFFPPRPTGWEEWPSICIASKSRSLGDAILHSTLPRRIKERAPNIRVTTYVRGFNPVIFAHNPQVDAVVRLPDAIHGDDANWGSGHLIQLKEQWFDLPPSPDPRPELYLTTKERAWAQKFVEARTLPGNEGKPLVILHPWGKTHGGVAPTDFWDALVARHSDRYRFWQVGLLGQSAIQGCEYYFLTNRSYWQIRGLFALQELAQKFVGVDSGPMHVAAAFEKPALIFSDHLDFTDAETVFKRRRERPHWDRTVWPYGFSYESHTHVTTQGAGTHWDRLPEVARKKVLDFFRA